MIYLLNFLQWLSTGAVLATIAVLAVPVWRDVVVKWIASRIQYDVDKRIETLRSDLRKAEETFKSEIRANERRTNSAVDVALGALSGRQSAVNARRLQAVDKLWANKAKLDRFKIASKFMSTIKFEAAARETAKNSQFRDLFAMMDKTFLPNTQSADDQLSTLESDRPFLSPVVWALYSAYSAVLLGAVIDLKFLAAGVGQPELLTRKPTDALLTAALPEHTAFIDKYSASGYHHLIEVLESKLLAATQDMLAGKEADAASLEQAASVLKIASSIRFSAPLSANIPESMKAENPPTDVE